MLDAKLKKARKKDKSSFRCVVCRKIKKGWGERVSDGHVCSKKCSDEKKSLSS